MISKEQYVHLAEAYIRQGEYEYELQDTVRQTAKKYGLSTDFLGRSEETGIIMGAVLDLLGDDFSYYFYECDGDFAKFNDGVCSMEGKHPNVHSLEDLYDFTMEEENE